MKTDIASVTAEGESNIIDTVTPFGPSGEVVYQRTYSRVKANGERETWPETVARVATGNLSLVYGTRDTWPEDVQYEYERLTGYMERFAILPAGRHLWASGVKGRQYLFNCHVAGWGEKFSDHFSFTALRLFEGGGVGANYSSRFLAPYGAPRRSLRVHIVCDPGHPDYAEMQQAGVLSTEFDSEWAGSRDVEDTREGWAAELVDLLDTYMTDDEVKHGDRVYDVSRVRQRGARLKSSGGSASGPAPFAQMMLTVADSMNFACALGEITPLVAMEIDHATAQAVVAGGNRRSARMSIVHWKDPAIRSFLACKADGSKHWTTNISVEIDDEFLAALKLPPCSCDERAICSCGARLAQRVHQEVVKGMLTNGEPGYWNHDLSNVGEPNEVIATNPCGEIALEAWENCNLGHVNLDAFAPTVGTKSDMLGMIEAHHLVTRFLIRATYGDVNDPKQAEKLARNRRIGVGHLGVQGFWAKRGVPYSDVPKTNQAGRMLAELYAEVRKAARDYAFELRIPEPVKVTTVAPTGTIAKMPGVGEGIHPIYSRHFIRRIRFSMSDVDQERSVNEFAAQGFAVELDVYDQSGNTVVVSFPTKDNLVAEIEAMGLPAALVESADEITLSDMLAFQAMYQEHWADNAVSYTVNVPAQPHQQEAMLAGGSLPPTQGYVAEVADTLATYLPRLKGTTLMVDGTRAQAPYERISSADYALYRATMVSDGIDENCATGACPVR